MSLPELEDLPLREQHRRENRLDDGEGLDEYEPRASFAAPAAEASNGAAVRDEWVRGLIREAGRSEVPARRFGPPRPGLSR